MIAFIVKMPTWTVTRTPKNLTKMIYRHAIGFNSSHPKGRKTNGSLPHAGFWTKIWLNFKNGRTKKKEKKNNPAVLKWYNLVKLKLTHLCFFRDAFKSNTEMSFPAWARLQIYKFQGSATWLDTDSVNGTLSNWFHQSPCFSDCTRNPEQISNRTKKLNIWTHPHFKQPQLYKLKSENSTYLQSVIHSLYQGNTLWTYLSMSSVDSSS